MAGINVKDLDGEIVTSRDDFLRIDLQTSNDIEAMGRETELSMSILEPIFANGVMLLEDALK